MKLKLLSIAATMALLSACGSPNDYDSHADQKDSDINTGEAHDTIQGRAPDSTNAVSDSSNIGIGDTTLNQSH